MLVFKDLPDTTTPINAENLNENFEECNNIVESGSNNSGKYIKFSDGTMICWNRITSTSSSTSQSNGIYYCPFTMAFPQEFIETPTVIPSLTQIAGLYFTSLGNNQPSTTQVQLRSLSMSAFTNVQFTYSYIAIGKWK